MENKVLNQAAEHIKYYYHDHNLYENKKEELSEQGCDDLFVHWVYWQVSFNNKLGILGEGYVLPMVENTMLV